MSSQWLWRIVSGTLILAACISALFFPQVNQILVAALVVILLISLFNARFSDKEMRYFGLLSILLILAFSIQNFFPQIRLSPYYLQFKIYRFFTLPHWFFIMSFLIFVFPGVKRFRELITALHTQMLPMQQPVLTFILIGLILSQLLTVASQVLSQGLYTVENRNLAPNQRYAVRKYGVGESGWFYEVGTFWNKVLPDTEDAVVGIPPQGEPWVKSGNIYYVLYFLSPRQVEMLPSDFHQIPKNISHLLIARGETDQGNFGWPKIGISKNQIDWIDVYDPFTKKEWKVENSDYNPEAFTSYYGVIHLKRESQ